MSEFIGSQIWLTSKSNVRYFGTLHDINSEESTVSLENVCSFGTEGREETPDQYIPPNDDIYDYIKFRGSDVKDLRIESKPPAPVTAPPTDPAILNHKTRRAEPSSQSPAGAQRPPQLNIPGASGAPGALGPNGPGDPGIPGYPYSYYSRAPANWGRSGPIGPAGYPGMPYAPGWTPGQFPPGPSGPPGPGGWNMYQYPPGMAGSIPPTSNSLNGSTGTGRPGPMNGPAPTQQPPKKEDSTVLVTSTALSKSTEKLAVPTPTTQASASAPTQAARATNSTDSLPPGQAPTPSFNPPITKTNTPTKPVVPKGIVTNDTTEAAKAAVALAMAKIANQNSNTVQSSVDNLTKRVSMRINNNHNHNHSHRGNYNNSRGSRSGYTRHHKIVVPEEDFDFDSSNAKFNKKDIVNAVEKASESNISVAAEVKPAYNKSTSFFDNISSEAKDRAENGGQKPSGREWRGEEQRKNVQTFGQSSVDVGYRGRGRGRGRGGHRGGRGRGGSNGGYQNRRPPRQEEQQS